MENKEIKEQLEQEYAALQELKASYPFEYARRLQAYNEALRQFNEDVKALLVTVGDLKKK